MTYLSDTARRLQAVDRIATGEERERAAKLVEAQVEEFDGMPYPAEMDVNEVLKMLTRLAEQIRSGGDG